MHLISQLQKVVPSTNVCWCICFLLCQDIKVLMYLGREYWRKSKQQKRSLWLVSESSMGLWDVCWVFLCFSKCWIKVKSEQLSPFRAAGVRSAAVWLSLKPHPFEQPHSWWHDFHILCLDLHVLPAKCEWWFIKLVTKTADQIRKRAIKN